MSVETRSSTSNQLAALLHRPFRCRQCGCTHSPDSRLIHHCGLIFATRHVVPHRIIWGPSTGVYWTREAWRAYNRQWSAAQERHFHSLITQLNTLYYHEQFGPATAAELAADDGVSLVTARHAIWHAQCQETLRRVKEDAAAVLAELEALLPPPYPVGAPMAVIGPDGLSWTPDERGQHELARVSSLFSARTRVSQNGRTIVLRVTIPRASDAQTPPARNYTRLGVRRSVLRDVREAIAAAFHADTLNRTSATQRIEELALDSAFWSTAHITRRTLTLTTQLFNCIAPPFQEDRNGQLLLAFHERVG